MLDGALKKIARGEYLVYDMAHGTSTTESGFRCSCNNGLFYYGQATGSSGVSVSDALAFAGCSPYK